MRSRFLFIVRFVLIMAFIVKDDDFMNNKKQCV